MLEKINQMKITIEIPTFKRTSGGIMRHVMLAKMLKEKEGLSPEILIGILGVLKSRGAYQLFTAFKGY